MITQSTCGQKVPPFNNQSFCFVFISVEWKITPVNQGVKYEVHILPGRIPGGNIQSSVPQFSACDIIAKHFTTHHQTFCHMSDYHKNPTIFRITAVNVIGNECCRHNVEFPLSSASLEYIQWHPCHNYKLVYTNDSAHMVFECPCFQSEILWK